MAAPAPATSLVPGALVASAHAAVDFGERDWAELWRYVPPPASSSAAGQRCGESLARQFGATRPLSGSGRSDGVCCGDARHCGDGIVSLSSRCGGAGNSDATDCLSRIAASCGAAGAGGGINGFGELCATVLNAGPARACGLSGRFGDCGGGGPCVKCRGLQRRLLDLSAMGARALTRARDVGKAVSEVEQARTGATAAAEALRRSQAELADGLQIGEDEMEEARRERVEAQGKWREEARAWQQRYDEAKVAVSHGRVEFAEAEEAAVRAGAEVHRLRRAVDEARLDVEDAHAACKATEARVSFDAEEAIEATARVRNEIVSEQAQASAATRLANVSRLEASGGALGKLRETAAAEERRCEDLELEMAELVRRLCAGRVAAGRLRALHGEAKERLQGASFGHSETASAGASTATAGRIVATTDRGDGPASELRREIEKAEEAAQNLEVELRRLRGLRQLEGERWGRRLERLRAKVELYHAGREDLRRLYRERATRKAFAAPGQQSDNSFGSSFGSSKAACSAALGLLSDSSFESSLGNSEAVL